YTSYYFTFNDTATTQIYTLSLHDALPIFEGDDADLRDLAREELAEAIGEVERLGTQLRARLVPRDPLDEKSVIVEIRGGEGGEEDRKSTRLNSSHVAISYAVFCLKKKKKK